MDPPEHTLYRSIYFSPDRMQAFKPACWEIVSEMVRSLPRSGEIEVMDGFAHNAAARIHAAFLGWPDDMHIALVDRTARSTVAVRAQDRQARAEIGGETLAAGGRVTVNWISANRDSRVFPELDTFRLDRNPADNVLYGKGIHVCPGAPLAHMELHLVMGELLEEHRRSSPESPKRRTARLIFQADTRAYRSGFSGSPAINPMDEFRC